MYFSSYYFQVFNEFLFRHKLDNRSKVCRKKINEKFQIIIKVNSNFCLDSTDNKQNELYPGVISILKSTHKILCIIYIFMAFFQKPVWCDNVEHNVKIYIFYKKTNNVLTTTTIKCYLFLRQIVKT